MSYLVIVIAVVAIILALISALYDLSMVYPTLMIVLALVLNGLSNTLKDRKNINSKSNLDIDKQNDEKNNLKANSEYIKKNK